MTNDVLWIPESSVLQHLIARGPCHDMHQGIKNKGKYHQGKQHFLDAADLTILVNRKKYQPHPNS